MKSREEVQRLKSQWIDDPCWDLEDTPGYEEYYEELLACRQNQERKWALLEDIRLRDLAIKYGIPGKTKLAAYIESLEDQIERLNWKNDVLTRQLAGNNQFRNQQNLKAI